MPAVGRHHDVDVEITNDVSVSTSFDCHENDVPRSASLPLSVDNSPVRLYESDPTGIRKAHAHIEHDERPLKECSSWPRLEGIVQFELIRHHACTPKAWEWAEESFLAMAPAHDLDRLIGNLQRAT